MNVNLLIYTVYVTDQVITKANIEKVSSHNYWMWIAGFELLVIGYLILFWKKSDNARVQFKKEAEEGDIDFSNVIKSSFHVKPLYDELKIKCHPDRFPNDIEKNTIALDLFQEIAKNKTNYKKLLELKELAKEKLNINF